MNILSGIIVVATGAFLTGLSIVIVFNPMIGQRYLESFASSARSHYTEQAIRLVCGAGFIVFSSSMLYSNVFYYFGWIVIIPTIGLLLIPWQWHHKYGQWAIPLAVRFIKVYAFGAVALGLFILYAALRPMTSL